MAKAKFPRVVDSKKARAERVARQEEAWRRREEFENIQQREFGFRFRANQDEDHTDIRRRFPHQASQD